MLLRYVLPSIALPAVLAVLEITETRAEQLLATAGEPDVPGDRRERE